ncbi:hypothetical protein NDK50_12485 [Paraburkholderia bryophila]|uniref:hypothetical protein n=1 Tax=Paraburkholderia bryophila TaxID=420952 RepID=UPI00234BA5F7|nr:hypothetical protein [Paraburkholderia bryophila]WCM18287.1 hypothetical protein NDK50_12485 [Paraburkholderia bryophila]
MVIITDIQSQARMLGILPVLLALGGWYLVRGDRLKHALRDRIRTARRPHVESGAAIIYLDRERARRRRFKASLKNPECLIECQRVHQGNPVKPIRLRVPREKAADLPDNLAAWAVATGIDPGLDVTNELDASTGAEMPILYKLYVSESFFEQFPQWRMYIEH